MIAYLVMFLFDLQPSAQLLDNEGNRQQPVVKVTLSF
jgi:hypothetical protein